MVIRKENDMKFKSLILSLLLIFSLSGCGEKEVVAVNVEAGNDANISQAVNSNIIGKSAMIEIGNGLYYDSTTGIVYWWDGTLMPFRSNADTTPTPYYSPNGLLYRYIPETNTMEEIRPDLYETKQET